jgi:hypothetical protein
MKTKILMAFTLLVLLFYTTEGQIINGRLSSSIYSFEKYDTVGESKTYLRGFQTVQLDITKNDVSLHTSIQAATNFTLLSDEQKNLKFYNLYLRWRNIFNLIDVNVGRHSVYAGVGNGLIDGATLKLKLYDNAISITGYGGGNVNDALEAKVTKQFKDNYLFGGQAVTTLIPDMRIGLSYMNRHREKLPYIAIRPDSQGLPVQKLIEIESASEQYAGADLSYNLKSYGRFYGRYEHDLNTEKISRGQFGAKISITDQVSITGDFIHREPRISYNSIFNVFKQSANTEIEGGVEYMYNPLVRLFAKFANVKFSGENTQRYTLGINAEYGSLIYSGNSGYAGDLNAISAQLMYPLFDNVLTPTIGISRSSYKLSKQSDRLDAFTGLFGATLKPSTNFSLDTQIQWMNNPVYKNDLRFLIRIGYLFTERLNIL